MGRSSGWLALCGCLGLSSLLPVLAADSVIQLLYTGRPPFIYHDSNGKLTGISYQIGEQVFHDTGLAYQWQQLPSARIEYYFVNNLQPLCLVNWIYTDERQRLGRVSLPTYREAEYLAVVPVARYQQFAGRPVRDILGDAQVTVLYKAGYAYSTVLTGLLQEVAVHKVDFRGSQQHNLMLLAEGRADIGFFAKEELDYLLEQHPSLAAKIATLRFDEINTVPTTRHIICSRQVTEAQLRLINQSISRFIRIAP